MIKKNAILIALGAATLALSAFGAFSFDLKTASAQPGKTIGTYQPLAPLPSQFFKDGYELGPYLQGMFRLLLALASVFAVIMITWGGIEYMSTDAISGKESGKDRIQNAVMGLFLALISWIILYTINPDLLSFKFFANTQRSQLESEGLGSGARGGIDLPASNGGGNRQNPASDPNSPASNPIVPEAPGSAVDRNERTS